MPPSCRAGRAVSRSPVEMVRFVAAVNPRAGTAALMGLEAEPKPETGCTWPMSASVLGRWGPRRGLAGAGDRLEAPARLGGRAAPGVTGSDGRRAYLPTYCAGLVGHLVGFHWVYQTVRVFGDSGRRPPP